MSHINENMDELFQKAAEEYPLKTGTPDWEDMRRKLGNESAYNYKKLLLNITQFAVAALLFIFIPLHIAVTGFVFHNIQNNNKISADVSNDSKSASAQTIIQNFAGSNLIKNTKVNNKNTFLPSQEILSNTAPAFDIAGSNLNNNNQSAAVIAPMQIASSKDMSVKTSISPNASAISVTADISQQKEEASEQPESNKRSKKQMININLHLPKRVYIGGLVAPEFASVKHQSIRKPGFDMGFVLGYKVNDKLQAEVAVVLSHKYYYTDGKYIAPNTLRHDELEIKGLNGFSSVTEIPITLQYNISKTSNSRFFAATGVVSSFVHRDRYNYDYTKNGQDQQGFKKYNKSSDNLFSNLQLSAGYEKKLGNLGNVRIEPYYRMPLNGIGAGNLPITSIGVNFGFIHYIK